jgi:hypothetical protein
MQKFRTLGQPHSEKKVTRAEERRGKSEKEKNSSNIGHYVLPAMTKGRAQNLLGPKRWSPPTGLPMKTYKPYNYICLGIFITR